MAALASRLQARLVVVLVRPPPGQALPGQGQAVTILVIICGCVIVTAIACWSLIWWQR